MTARRVYLLAERREPGTGADRIVSVPCSAVAKETLEVGGGSPLTLGLGVRGPWWLVESESADAARRTIARLSCKECGGIGECNTGSSSTHERGDWYACRKCGDPIGRILASGGGK